MIEREDLQYPEAVYLNTRPRSINGITVEQNNNNILIPENFFKIRIKKICTLNLLISFFKFNLKSHWKTAF